MKKAYTRDLGVDELYGVPFYFGYHHGLNFPAEDVYRALKVFEAAGAASNQAGPWFRTTGRRLRRVPSPGDPEHPRDPSTSGIGEISEGKGLMGLVLENSYRGNDQGSDRSDES